MLLISGVNVFFFFFLFFLFFFFCFLFFCLFVFCCCCCCCFYRRCVKSVTFTCLFILIHTREKAYACDTLHIHYVLASQSIHGRKRMLCKRYMLIHTWEPPYVTDI